jgi:hypothetical protein
MRTTIVTWLTLAIVVMGFSLGSADDGKGGQAASFLRNPVGGRAGGMGDAFVAVANDAGALYYNPAGLCQIKHLTCGLMYSAMSLDRSHYQASAIYTKEGIASFGAMFTGFGVSDIDGRNAQGDPTAPFDDNEWALTIGAARKLNSVIAFGGSFKYFNHSLAGSRANALAFDLGAHAHWTLEGATLRGVGLGVAVTNLGAKLKWNTQSAHEDKIPMTLRAGASTELALGGLEWLIALDGTQTADESFGIHAGAEAWIKQMLGLRAGIDDGNFTLGGSVRYRQFQIDYAYRPDELEAGATSRMGLQIVF